MTVIQLDSFRGNEMITKPATVPERVAVLEEQHGEVIQQLADMNKKLDEVLEIFKFAKYGSRLIYVTGKTLAWIGATAVSILALIELVNRAILGIFPFSGR